MTDIQDVQATNEAFYRAFEKKDMEAMALVWSQGTGCLCIHPGREALRGWEAIQTSWQQIFRNTQYLEIDVDLMSTELSGNLAYIVLVEHLRQIVRGRELNAQSLATNVFEKMGDRWYMVHHHGSPIVR